MKRNICLLIMSAILVFVSGCGSSVDNTIESNMAYDSISETSGVDSVKSDSFLGALSGAGNVTSNATSSSYNETAQSESTEQSFDNNTENVASSQKLIKTVDMDIDTENFDSTVDSIYEAVESTGGYIEYSDVWDTSYGGSDTLMTGTFAIRVPADKLEQFDSTVSGLATVSRRSEQVEDVTLNYVDTQSKIEALETEQARLLELLEIAQNLEEVLTIEDRLSDVRYELESYESRIRTLDNQIAYSTFNIRVNEVERESGAKEDEGMIGEAFRKFGDSLYGVGMFLRGLIVGFIGSLPWLVPIAAIVFFFVRHVRKKKAKKLGITSTKKQSLSGENNPKED